MTSRAESGEYARTAVNGRQGLTVTPGMRRAVSLRLTEQAPRPRDQHNGHHQEHQNHRDLRKDENAERIESDTRTAATKAPMMLPSPPITTTTNTSTMTRKSIA